MIAVVADTSPLNYLVQIDCQHLLQVLFGPVLVPLAVVKELDHPGAPAVVRAFVRQVPEWLVVRRSVSPPDQSLAALDPGEREAIQLALEEHADLLLMEEKTGAGLARRRGLTVTGTLGVLVEAARRELVDMEVALVRGKTPSPTARLIGLSETAPPHSGVIKLVITSAPAAAKTRTCRFFDAPS